MRRSWLLSALIVFCFSCTKPLPELTGIDLRVWKNDHKGCKGTRVQFSKALDDQRSKLKGLSEMDIVTLLGKPDQNILSQRHEKFYRYFIEPALECSDVSGAMYLEVRFNATGVSREAVISAVN